MSHIECRQIENTECHQKIQNEKRTPGQKSQKRNSQITNELRLNEQLN